ncbi:MAG TPA: sigma-70 family RNA polymerase sigma factor [Cellulomonas sp.]
MGTGGDRGGAPPTAAERAAAAFADAYRLLAPQVRGYVRRQLPADQVDDVVSETFVVVWRRWADAPAGPDELRPWVFGVARHKILHAHEQRGRAAGSLVRAAGLAQTRAGEPDPAEDLASHDRTRRLLALLPRAEAEAMALTVWAALTPAEAARVLGCSQTALTSRLSRARARLATALRAGAEGRDDDLAAGGDIVHDRGDR